MNLQIPQPFSVSNIKVTKIKTRVEKNKQNKTAQHL